MNSPEGSSFNNTVNQMLELEKKLLKFYENDEAKRVLLKVPRSFSGSENFSDGIGIVILNHWSERRPINEIIEEYKSFAEERSASKMSEVINEDVFESARVNLNNLIF